jgi:hypothetical protein
MLFDPLVSFDTISRDELNDCLVAWKHKMGPIRRPEYRAPVDLGVRHHGELVAVVASDSLIRETCGLGRSDAFELSRLCAARPGLCRVAVRLWREFVYPDIARSWRTPWAISYQDAAQHSGDLYRFDGWVRLGYSTSGSDPRALPGTAAVRRKVIWGWNSCPDAMGARRNAPLKVPAWAEREAA